MSQNTNDSKPPRRSKQETDLVHAGEPIPRIAGAVTLPIFQTSIYETRNVAEYRDIRYIRLANSPNHIALHEKLAQVEGGEHALVASSGMAAITSALLSVLKSGDHLLVQDSLYGGTEAFLMEDATEMGITFDHFDASDPASWKAKLKPRTKLIYVESISNPLLRIPALRDVVRFARENALLSFIDNTFATPINFRPIDLGFDVVLHSATKYLNGHSDVCAGVMIGSKSFTHKAWGKLSHFGGALDPHAAYLLHRALKTLHVRVRAQNENALAISRFLERHEAVRVVHYPGLESHPQHTQARELFRGFGGMVTFERKGGEAAAERLLERLRCVIVAPSLGGVESSITRPAATSHYVIPAAERNAMGVNGALLRFSVGIEHVDDLIADLAQALA
jgi:cystathionine beta-lyase/cystathionine gamma-synthase